MWANLFQFLAFLVLNRKVQAYKDKLRSLRHDLAEYTEDRAQLLKQDFQLEMQRLFSSFARLLLGFTLLIFTGMLGLMWLFSLLWAHPHRSLILGGVMLVPMVAAAIVLWRVHKQWQQKPLFEDSLGLIAQDWQLLRQQMVDNPPPASARQTNTRAEETSANSHTATQEPAA